VSKATAANFGEGGTGCSGSIIKKSYYAEQSFSDMCRLVTGLANGDVRDMTGFAAVCDCRFPDFNCCSHHLFMQTITIPVRLS